MLLKTLKFSDLKENPSFVNEKRQKIILILCRHYWYDFNLEIKVKININ
jgi:uncharacterized protein YcfL